MSLAPLAPNENQPPQAQRGAAGGPDIIVPRTRQVESEIARRLFTLRERQQNIQNRVLEIETESSARPKSLRVLPAVKGLLSKIPAGGGAVANLIPGPSGVRTQGDDAALDALEAERTTLRTEAVRITNEALQAEIQLQVARVVPGLVMNRSVTTMDELIDKIGSELKSPTDIQLAQRSFDIAAEERDRFEASLDSTPEEFIQALGKKRNITVYGLTALASTNDLVGYIRELRAAQLPQGATLADMREVLGNAGIPAEASALFLEEAEDFSTVWKQEISTLRTRSQMWQAGIVDAIDNGTFAQELENFREGVDFWENPGLYIGLPIKWMDKNYWKPLAGGLTHTMMQLDSITPRPLYSDMRSFLGLSDRQYAAFQVNYDNARADGTNIWQAYGVAFEEHDTNAVSKIVVEMIADPTSYLGFGVAKLFKFSPRLYNAVHGLERGWIRAVDLPFIALQKGISKIIPRFPGQIAARDSMQHVQVVADYLNKADPRGVSFQQMPMTTIRNHMNLAARVLNRNPNHSGVITDSVRGLLERPIMTREEAATIIREVGSPLGQQLDQVANDLDAALSHSRSLPGGMTLAPEETIEIMLSHLGVVRTPEIVAIIERVIRNQRQQALSTFENILDAPNTKDFIKRILDHRTFLGRANQLNPLSEYRSKWGMYMASMSSSNRRGAALTGLSGMVDMANRVAYGFTRMYLMSTFYGPFNILETAVKSAVMSINPRFRGKPILHLQNLMMGYEDIMPRIFIQGDRFLPQAQDMATAGATAAARDSGSRQSFKRIWNTKQNILTKFYQSADEAFIQTGSRLGLEQAAHVMNSLIERHMLENIATGPVVESIAQKVAQHMDSSGLRQVMSKEAFEMHTQEMFRLAIHEASGLGTMSQDFVQGYVHAAGVQELLSKYATLDPQIREYLTETAISNDLFRLLRSGELHGNVTEAIWQNIFAEPEIYMARIRELTKAVLEIPPDTLEGLRVQTAMLEDLNSATIHTVEQQMSATQTYTRDMLNLQKKNDVWETQWTTKIQPIMAAGEESARQIVESLQRNLREKGFNLNQQAITQYDDLINQQLLRIQTLTKSRNSINEFTRAMLEERDNVLIPRLRREGKKAGSDAPEIREWWGRFNGGRDRIWKESQTEIAEQTANLSAIAGSLDAFPLPQPKDVSGKPLVMADVAYLYGVGPDSVTQGLYLADLKMMRPKQEWINLVYGQARRVMAPNGQSPEAMGFAKARLEVLYDQHLHALRINPAVNNLSAPRFAEWEGLHKELQTYAQASGIIMSGETTGLVDVAARGLLDDLAADPITREVVEAGARNPLPINKELLDLEDSLIRADDDVVRLTEAANLSNTDDADKALFNAAAARNPIAEQLNTTFGTTLTPDEMVARVKSSPGGAVSAPRGETIWGGKKRGAMQDAVDEYNINFPVYDQNNALNAGLRNIFPFWTYEAHRWSYLPRVAIRNPGLTHAWGLYGENTDRGYIPVPGTSLQINPLRNSIMMGGLQRFVNRDFPEFYDQYPDFANYMDQAGRLGFYPNAYFSAFMSSPLSNKAGVWQTGEIVPPPIGTALEGIIAVDPDNPFADALANIILPNRFRDYRVSVRMAMNLPAGEGNIRAADILFKRLSGEDFTPEEQEIWDNAERRASLDSMVDYQVGLFRLRPEEMLASRELAKQIILKYVPISETQYDEAHKLGMPIEQYFPYPIELNEELQAIEEIARWRGLSSGLGESDVARMLLVQRQFWQRVEDRRTALQEQELQLDLAFRQTGEGHITRRQWEGEKRALSEQMNRFIEDLKVSPDFIDVPIEYQDRVDFARLHNTIAPIQHPIEEMITYYFSRSPEDFQFFDPDIGAITTDWDGFYKWRSVIENSIEGDDQATFMGRIRKWDTDLDTFRRNDFEVFIRPYKNLFGLTLAEFSEIEQAIIRQFYSADSVTTKEELRAITAGDGESQLVSNFQTTLSERRRRLRVLDPDMDARLAFWGETSSLVTEQARVVHAELFGQYGIQTREIVPIETTPIPDLTQETQ